MFVIVVVSYFVSFKVQFVYEPYHTSCANAGVG